jgi:hypothetical protein
VIRAKTCLFLQPNPRLPVPPRPARRTCNTPDNQDRDGHLSSREPCQPSPFSRPISSFRVSRLLRWLLLLRTGAPRFRLFRPEDPETPRNTLRHPRVTEAVLSADQGAAAQLHPLLVLSAPAAPIVPSFTPPLRQHTLAVGVLLLMLVITPRPRRGSAGKIAPPKGRSTDDLSRPGVSQHQPKGINTPITLYDRTDWYHPIDQE